MKKRWKFTLVLAAASAVAFIVLAIGHASPFAEACDDCTKSKIEKDAEGAITPAVKKVDDMTEGVIKFQIQLYTDQLRAVREKRRLFEEAVTETRKGEQQIEGKIEALRKLYEDMREKGFVVLDSKQLLTGEDVKK